MISTPKDWRTKDWLEICSLSDVGLKRPHNEDSTGCDLRTGLAVLADGMGGYEAGELASALAVAHVISHMRCKLSEFSKAGFDEVDDGLCKGSLFLRRSITTANQDIYQRAKGKKSFKGMGTTLVAALFYEGNNACIAHVGDSRMYRLRGTDFKQITRDHSLLEDLVDRGLCSREEASEIPNKHLVTRALGKEAEVKVAIQEISTEENDLYLICSDGLTDLVDDEAICSTLKRLDGNLRESAQELINQANAKGGKDNISIILARLLPETAVTKTLAN